MEKNKSVGKTKDAGFQVGVRKNFPVPLEKTWDFLLSSRGSFLWLGEIDIGSITIKEPFITVNGLEGTFTVIKPNSHLRMKWKPSEWPNQSTLQIRVISIKEKTTISFHQEHLIDKKQREKMKIW
jgi:uncharacterized protein YndB with AHSA1/START domain